MGISFFTKRDLFGKNLETLKDLRDKVVNEHKETVIHEQVAEIKSYALYSEIIDTLNEIVSDGYYEDFSLSVDVTMQAGQRQYESEGKPVA